MIPLFRSIFLQLYMRQFNLLHLLQKFIRESKSGKRLTTGGQRISKGTIRTYHQLAKLLLKYEDKHEPIVVTPFVGRNKRKFNSQKRYWKKFIKQFSDLMYDDLDHYDNYVGSQFKIIKTFFRWLRIEQGIDVLAFEELFPVPKEEIDIVVLNPSQLRFLMMNQEFEQSLSNKLRRTKDMFVFGCCVALRVGDLLNLKKADVIQDAGQFYLLNVSQKTKAVTRVLLPNQLGLMLTRIGVRGSRLFPRISISNLNTNIKELIKTAGWDEIKVKYRSKRGVPTVQYKNAQLKQHYRFYDHISSHSMRRTAITTYLQMGMDELNVRRISGHTAGSKEFYRYVKYSQDVLDEQTKIAHENLFNLALNGK